ncbi:rifampicin phosphotransferase-like [Dermacentor albipictus]|uniref:rifampicin phosphotransferase-like n=1 Tax=Dermacentor albipictus TaxID=60249 RepID=UPI0038FCFB3E
MMAGTAAALTAALLALFGELYRRGIKIWLDHGFIYLFRYQLAVVQLTYLLRRKGRRFRYLESEHNDDVVSSGAISAPLEWTQECPRKKEELDKGQDKVLFYGVNTAGDRLVVNVSRLRNHLAEFWVALYTPDGAQYSLPASLTLDRSAGSCFSAAGVRLQCLAPNRRWRVAFNGLLRKQRQTGSLGSQEMEVHVKFGFIWSTVSHTLEMPAELAPTLLAESLAKMPLIAMLRDVSRLVSEMDSHDQAGMMSGEVTVDGETREVTLWGYKIRSQGSLPRGTYEEHHHLGYLENGDMYHLVRSTNYGGENGVSYGSIYAPTSMMRPIDCSLVRMDEALHAERSKTHIGSGQVFLPVDVKRAAPLLTLASDESSSDVHLTAIDLKCEGNHGSGFILSVNRSERMTDHIPEHIRHKIIEEHELPKVLPLVSDIRDQCSRVPQLTGGKGSSLAVLDSIATEVQTFSVPRGFIITTKSYELFSANEEFGKLVQQIETARGRDDWQTALKEVCSRVVDAIEEMKMPTKVAQEISFRVSTFRNGTAFAVRSSAIGEDSEDMSAAGQMTTLLGVQGQENVISAVVKCWASQYSFTNVNYKRQYGQPLDVPMAVVVQELVEATAAGVMFTCDPLTGSPSYITVTANYGIGESVVSASADPDTFVLKKTGTQTLTIESKQIGHKSVYTTTSENGGVVTVPLSSEKAQISSISDKDVEKLAIIGMQIEKTYTIPQDIEWALYDGKFFMLQSRPVTTFLRETDCEMIHEFDTGLKSPKEILTKGNVSEVLPGAMPPLTSCFLRAAFDIYIRDGIMRFSYAFEQDRTQYVALWMRIQRYNYFLWLSNGQQRIGADASLMERSVIHSIMGRDAAEEVNGAVERVKKMVRWKLPAQLYYTAKAMLTLTHGVEETSRKTAQLRLSVDGMVTATQMYDYIKCHVHKLREPGILLMKVSMASSFYNAVILQILGAAERGLGNDLWSELSKILYGTEVESADVPKMIQELGRVLRESPDREKFLNMTTEEATEWLLKSENECGQKFREFIKKHGHRSVKEFDLYTKPWALDPSSLVKSLKAAARAPQVEGEAPAASRDLSTITRRLSALRRIMLKLVAPKARGGVAAREAAKSASVRVFHQLRLVCHQLARRMVHEGRLPSADLVFFLTFEEIGILLRTRNPELVLKAQRRQKIHAQLDKDRYPSIFVGIPKPIERIKRHIEGDFEVKGNPMSQGVVEGKARVVPSFEEAHLIQKGEILVTTATDTGWTPYFPLLAGVVTEVGGPLSHGAVVAREYGLPCIVGVEGITTMLATGDYLHLDGNKGLLRRITVPAAEDD